MSDYVASCGFPLVKIGEIPIPRLVLGHLPFLGESYQGIERNKEFTTRFSNMKNTQRILEIAVEKFGVTVTATGTTNDGEKLVNIHFEAIRETGRNTGIEFAIIPCVQIPITVARRPVDVYRRWLTYYEAERKQVCIGLLQRYLEDPVLQSRSNWKKKFAEALRELKPYEAPELQNLHIDYRKLDKMLTSLKDFKVLLVEVGSETDFLAMTGRVDLLSDLVYHIREKYGKGVLAGIHHAGSTIPILERSKVELDGYITPINKLGVMMFPDKDSALKSIRKCGKPVIAIKPLAGGRIPPREAFHYIYKELEVASCMVGVGSESEAEVDFSTASEILSSLQHA